MITLNCPWHIVETKSVTFVSITLVLCEMLFSKPKRPSVVWRDILASLHAQCNAIQIQIPNTCNWYPNHCRPQRPRSFWSAPRIATSGLVQHRKSATHGLPVTLRMFIVKSDKSDWFWSQSIVFSKPFKNGMSLDRARGRDSWSTDENVPQ